MNRIRAIALLLALPLLTTGCATNNAWYEDWRNCAMAGAVAGAAAGSTDDSDAAAIGAVGGAVIAGTLCALTADEEEAPADSDGDGVVDGVDRCPGTAPGVTVDAYGCEADSDGDGVVNSADQCPGTVAGATVDAHGCELDSDGDGVVDRLDNCPNTPAGTTVDNSGCPITEDIVLEGVNFEFDSDKLLPASLTVLDDVMQILNRHPDITVEIEGHTDSQGPEEYNKALSQRRADAVRAHLISEGANADNMRAKGYGESDPIADNGTPEGRAKNRRVEFHVD